MGGGMTGGELGLAAAGCTIAGFAIDRLLHPTRKISRRFEEFLDDWNGEPERRTPDGAVVLKERQKGIPERMAIMEVAQQTSAEQLGEVKKLLNGGGLGSQMSEIGARVAQIDARSAEHIDQANATRDELVGRLDSQDSRLEESSAQARRAAELAGEAAATVSSEVQRLAEGLEAVSERVDALDIKVERRLFVVEDAERTHRAMLHEVGFEVDLPDPDDAA